MAADSAEKGNFTQFRLKIKPQAPLSKYSPPTHNFVSCFVPNNMLYSTYSLYKYTSRTKYTLIAWE